MEQRPVPKSTVFYISIQPAQSAVVPHFRNILEDNRELLRAHSSNYTELRPISYI